MARIRQYIPLSKEEKASLKEIKKKYEKELKAKKKAVNRKKLELVEQNALVKRLEKSCETAKRSQRGNESLLINLEKAVERQKVIKRELSELETEHEIVIEQRRDQGRSMLSAAGSNRIC